MIRTATLLALAAGATLAPGLATAQPGPPPPLAGTRLEVVAEGEVARAPDLVGIGAGVVTQASTAAAAMRQNATRMAATVAALRAAGVADRDIQTSALGLSPQYRYAENQPPVITGYQASNQVNVRFRDVARAGPVLDALVAAGANQISGPNLTIDQPDAALDEARRQAITKARARSTLYAQAAGLRVKRIVAISEAGGNQPSPPMPMMAMARAKAADTSIEPGEQRLAVTLNVTFELE